MHLGVYIHPITRSEPSTTTTTPPRHPHTKHTSATAFSSFSCLAATSCAFAFPLRASSAASSSTPFVLTTSPMVVSLWADGRVGVERYMMVVAE